MEATLTSGAAVDAITDALWLWHRADGVDAYRCDPEQFITDYCCGMLNVKCGTMTAQTVARIRKAVDGWLEDNAERISERKA